MKRKLRRPVSASSSTSEPENVGRHQIGRELHPLLGEAEHDAQSLDQTGLGEPGNADQQDVAARQQRDQRLPRSRVPGRRSPDRSRRAPDRNAQSWSRPRRGSPYHRSSVVPGRGGQLLPSWEHGAGATNWHGMSMCDGRPFGSTPGRSSRRKPDPPGEAATRCLGLRICRTDLAVLRLADPTQGAGQAVRLGAAARAGRQLLAGHPGRARAGSRSTTCPSSRSSSRATGAAGGSGCGCAPTSTSG